MFHWPVGVDHKVPVGKVHLRRLALVLPVEELRQTPLLYGVYSVVVEPGTVAGHHNVVCLVCWNIKDLP